MMDDKEMVKWIAENTEMKQRGGVWYVTKKIPDREGVGILDPRLFESAKKGVGISYPKDNRAITAEELAVMRREIGAPNTEVTKGELREDTLVFGNVRVHCYQPASEKRLPVLIYIHGGGFLGGSIQMCENLCRDLARTAPAAVFSVDYRLAPEHPYPEGLNDCFAAVDGIFSVLDAYNADPLRVSISGDSAGGNLALCCCMRESDQGSSRISRQILLYPAVNIGKYEPSGYHWEEAFYTYSEDEEERSVQKLLAHDVGIFDDLMTEAYAGGRERTNDRYVCPVLNEDWSHMPETAIVLGEYDYLTQEGMYLAKQIAGAGVPVSVYHYLGMCHAFAENLGTFPQAEDLMREMAAMIGGVKK